MDRPSADLVAAMRMLADEGHARRLDLRARAGALESARRAYLRAPQGRDAAQLAEFTTAFRDAWNVWDDCSRVAA